MPMMIPSFLLKKLYVPGSFKNNPTGFELAVRNSLAPGTLIGVGPMAIDDRDIPTDKLWIAVNNNPPVRASDISPDAPRLFPMNATVTFRIEDQSLDSGKHHVVMAVNIREAGELKIDAEDSIS
jgi:hypothetical protein